MSVKRARRTRAELRDLMLTAGKEVLFQVEPSLGFEQLTYSSVFDHLEANYDQRVTIGSVHERIWTSQREFQLEVLSEILDEVLALAPSNAMQRASRAIEAVDITTPAGRRYAAQNSIRLNSYLVAEQPSPEAMALAHTVRFRLWTLGPNHPEAQGFTETIRTIRQASTIEYSQIMRAIMQILQIRVRADAGNPDQVFESVAVMGNATTLGLRTDVLDAACASRLIPSGRNGELEPWYPDALAVWSFVRSMFELDGDDLSADERRL